MNDPMQRINLNVPAGVRAQLRDLAAAEGRTEGEMARTLLMAALEGARRELFYRAVSNAQTPVLHARDRANVQAFERLEG
jgi:plasmid stability protein